MYYYDIPSDTTGIIITGTEYGNGKQTANYENSWSPALNGNNAAYFVYDNGDKLAGLSYENTSPSSSSNSFCCSSTERKAETSEREYPCS